MKRVLIYRHPDCAKCGRFARLHHLLDWLNRVADTTVDPPTGPLRRGEIIVETFCDQKQHRGADALTQIFRQIPFYWPLLPLLRIPSVRTRFDIDLSGCVSDACHVPHPSMENEEAAR